MRRAIPLLAACLVAAGCSNPSPTLNIVVASSYMGLDCPAPDRRINSLTNVKSLRLSARFKDASGKAAGFCNIDLDTSAASVWGFPRQKAVRVDLFVEAFGGAGDVSTDCIAGGALLDVDPSNPTPPPLYLFEPEKFGCTPGTRLNVPRGFHTATRLSTGHILFIGGLAASPEGRDVAAPVDAGNNPGFFASSAVEVYDPVTRTISILSDPKGPVEIPRAFHRAGVVAGAAGTEGKFTILLAGGVTPTDPTMTVVHTDSAHQVPSGFRFFLEANAAEAPAELLVFDPSVTPMTAVRMRAPMAVQEVSGVLQGSLERTGGGVVLAGGMQLAKMPPAQSTLASTRDGMAVQKNALLGPRSGATLAAAVRDANDSTTDGLLVGGVARGGDMTPPFERINLATLQSTAANSSLALLPPLYLPTVTLMDNPPGAAPRFLISGGLEVLGSGSAVNPPSNPAISMFQVVWNPSDAALNTTVLKLHSSFSGAPCTADNAHFKVVAFDAATLLPAGDRVLVTGGTPRNVPLAPSCRECENGDDNLGCAIGQSVLVKVPAMAAEVPEIVPAGRLTFPRFGHTQTVLPDGNILVVGGLTRRNAQSFAVAQSEIFNPARTVGAAPRQVNDNEAEPDDPLRDDILRITDATKVTRRPGGLAFASGDGNKTPLPSFRCVPPSK